MTTLRQVAQQALEVMDDHMYRADTHEFYEAKEALRAALAEPEQEPWKCACGANLYIDPNGKPQSKAAPTPRKPLHDMAVFDLADKHLYEGGKNYGVLAFARAIERAHGIGEQT